MPLPSILSRKKKLSSEMKGAGKTTPVETQVSTPQTTVTATTPQGLNIKNVPTLPVSATGALPMITVGGSASTVGERLFPVTNQASPTSNAINYSLSGSGHGIDKFGRRTVSTDLEQLLQRQIDTGTPTALTGHSMGSVMLFNTLQRMGQLNNPLFTKNFVDAPNLKWWQGPPRAMNWTVPTAQEIQRANDAGIANNPNTINWTGGNWLFNPEKHSPWNFPNYPGSQGRMMDLQNRLKAQTWNPFWMFGAQ